MSDNNDDSSETIWKFLENLKLTNWASFEIDIVDFRPWGGIFPITANVKFTGSAPETNVSCEGNNISVSPPTLPSGSEPTPASGSESGIEPAALLFNLPDADYIILGTAWVPADDTVSLGESVFTFKDVLIRRELHHELPDGRSLNGSSMMVSVNLPVGTSPSQAFNYLIFIQRIANGEIGVIDPRIIANPN